MKIVTIMRWMFLLAVTWSMGSTTKQNWKGISGCTYTSCLLQDREDAYFYYRDQFLYENFPLKEKTWVNLDGDGVLRMIKDCNNNIIYIERMNSRGTRSSVSIRQFYAIMKKSGVKDRCCCSIQ